MPSTIFQYYQVNARFSNLILCQTPKTKLAILGEFENMEKTIVEVELKNITSHS